jgi:MFS family permease
MLAAATPFAVLAPIMPNGEMAIILGAFAPCFGMASSVPQNAAIQMLTPGHVRGQVTAIYLFLYTLLGSCGSFFIGLITEFVIGDESKVWISMSIVAGVLLPLGCICFYLALKPFASEMAKIDQAEVV